MNGIEAIGIDEEAARKGHRLPTLVYQIDVGCRRLLWIGEERKLETLERFFRVFGKNRTEKLKYICSDMWKAYRTVVRQRAPSATPILDRFHTVKLFNKAIDQVRVGETRQLSIPKRGATPGR